MQYQPPECPTGDSFDELQALVSRYRQKLSEGGSRPAKVRPLPYWPRISKEDQADWSGLAPDQKRAWAECRIIEWLSRVRRHLERYQWLLPTIRPEKVITTAQAHYRIYSGGSEMPIETLRETLRGIWGPGLPPAPDTPKAASARPKRRRTGARRQPTWRPGMRLPVEPLGPVELRKAGMRRV
jgi:hypothetical protein